MRFRRKNSPISLMSLTSLATFEIPPTFFKTKNDPFPL